MNFYIYILSPVADFDWNLWTAVLLHDFYHVCFIHFISLTVDATLSF
jgi:hypothetical protein